MQQPARDGLMRDAVRLQYQQSGRVGMKGSEATAGAAAAGECQAKAVPSLLPKPQPSPPPLPLPQPQAQPQPQGRALWKPNTRSSSQTLPK